MTMTSQELERDESNDERVFSLQQFVEDLDYAIRWEQLNGCQEAAFEDIPARYSDCLSVFTHVGPQSGDNDGLRVQTNQNLLLPLLGTANLNQEWPLPHPLYALSEADKLSPKSVVAAHQLSNVKLSAAIFPSLTETETETETEIPTKQERSIRQQQQQHLNGPIILPSTTITSSKEIFGRQVSFYTLRRYNRLATTSILRTAYALGVDIPVIGILICYNRIAIHIDWYQIVHGEFTCNSAFYTTTDDDETDMQIWNTNQPDDAQQITRTFSNIHNYTITRFDTLLRRGEKSRIQQKIADLRLDDKNIPSPPSTPDFSF